MLGDEWTNKKKLTYIHFHIHLDRYRTPWVKHTHPHLHWNACNFFVLTHCVPVCCVYKMCVCINMFSYICVIICLGRNSIRRWRWERKNGKKWVNHKKRKTSFLGIIFSYSIPIPLCIIRAGGKGRETKKFISFAFFATNTTNAHSHSY